MDKQAKIALMGAVLLVSILLVGFVLAARVPKECNDKIDNDGDGMIDLADAGCVDRGDNDETNCGDGVCEGGETVSSCQTDCGVADSCSDTDGGNVTTLLGTTSGYYNNNPYSNSDYCADAGNIMEYYCSGAYEQSQQQSCGTDYYSANYCSNSSVYRNYTDYSCSTGACGSSTTPELVQTCGFGCTNGTCNPPPDSCSDTDGGYVAGVQGTVSGYLNATSYSNTDYCVDTRYLKEYYCAGTRAY